VTFLQPGLLWALPAVLLPVLIHFLNRLRFRSVKWAAIMFLISATRSSTKHAQLRQYLILLCRTLMILFLVLSLCRPIVGGWLGSAFSGAPDTILVLLDRSASMEVTDPRWQVSKRVHALKLFKEAADKSAGASRYVLIENALRAPQEIAAQSLENISLTSATETSADLPAMLRAALDYIFRNHTGKTEIWIASDLQKSNWRPESAEWQTLSSQLASLPQDIRVRLLALPDSPGRDVSISLSDCQRRKVAGRSQLNLVMDINRLSPGTISFPLIITLNGVRSQVDISMDTQSLRLSRKLEISGTEQGGWGKIEIPADENLLNNSCYFAYGNEAKLHTAIAADNSDAGEYLRLAAAPSRDTTNRTCETFSPGNGTMPDWKSLSLLIWQGHGKPENDGAIQSFVENGGALLIFPPAREETTSPLGLRWNKIETAGKSKNFRISSWEENEGPLAKTDSGKNLPVPALSFNRRQVADTAAASNVTWFTLASFTDGKPFLSRRNLGRGQVFICTSLPTTNWSNLGEGIILVPMVQRMLVQGGRRFTEAENIVFGEIQQAVSDNEVWTALDSKENKDFRFRAGVYQYGSRRMAVNRPALEDIPDTIEKEKVRQLFGDVRLQILEELSGKNSDKMQSEIWQMFLYLMLICMIAEALLLLSDRISGSFRENEALRANVSGIASRATPEARSFFAESGVAISAFIPRTKSPGSPAKTDELKEKEQT